MSSFGEISEPSTRTAWEDWDDVILKETFPKLCFQKDMNTPSEFATLLILEGRYLYNCVRDRNELEHVNSVPEVNLHLYRTKDLNTYICIIKDYNLVQSSEIVELLKHYITEGADVIGILTKPLVEYQVAKLVTTDYVMRSLVTSKQIPRNSISDIASLEQPNMIAGFVAGALCLREIIDKPAVALVYYMSTEDQDIHELHNILEKLQVISQVEKYEKLSAQHYSECVAALLRAAEFGIIP